MDSSNRNINDAVRRGSVVIGIVAFAVGMGWGLPISGDLRPNAWADMSTTAQMGGMQEGEVTSIGSTTLDVAGHMYRLHPDVTIKDDKGRPMELKQLRPGLVVQYWLKENALSKIVVLLPR